MKKNNQEKTFPRFDLCSRRTNDLKEIEKLLVEGWEPFQVLQEALPVEQDKSSLELPNQGQPSITFVLNVYFKRCRRVTQKELDEMKEMLNAPKKDSPLNVLNK